LSLFSSSKNNYKILNANKSIIKAEKSYSRAYLDYRQKLLLTAETYFLKGFTCFPTAGKKPLPGFTMEKYNNWNISYEEFKEIFNSDNGTISGIALLGGYNPYFGAYFNCVDIDDLRAFEKLLKSEISDKFFTTRIKTYRGYQHYILSDYEVVGAKILYFEGQKIGEFRGTGVYWVAPPSEFFWPDRENPHKLLFYQYRICEPEYPLIKIGEKGVEEIFEFFQVKGTRTRGTINRQEKETIPETSERPDSTTEKNYQVEFGKVITGNYERLFSLLGYSGLCPFHEETNPSFGFYTAENGTKRAHDFHNEQEDFSMGELFLYYPKEPAPKGAIEEPEEREKLSKGLYTVFNKIANYLSENIDNIEVSINSEPFQKIINGKRRRNRWGYKKALLFILGLVLLKKNKYFILPIEIVSKLIGVSRMQGLKFLKQLEAEKFIKPKYKRRSKNSKNRVWVYQKGERLKAIL